MSDEREGPGEGIEMLRRAVDDLAERLPARSEGRSPTPAPRHGAPAVFGAVVTTVVLAAAAVVIYRVMPGPAAPAPGSSPAPAASAASLGVEVKRLRVRGRDVGARVFDAARAGTVVVAPEPGGGR